MKGLKGACVAMIISVGLSVLNIVLAADIIHMERPQEPSKEPTEKELKKIESGLVEIDRKIEFLMEFQKKSIEIQLDIDCPLSTLDVEEQSEAEVEPVDGSNWFRPQLRWNAHQRYILTFSNKNVLAF